MGNSGRIMIVAGEASGDLYGSKLIREMRRMSSGIEVFGIGGSRMEESGAELYYHIGRMSLVGFIEVAGHLLFIRKVLSEMEALLDRRRPDLLIVIDYSGFNLRLAKAAKKRAIPVMYYISPKVWAWGAWRIPKIVRSVSKMVVIFPFEELMYRRHGLDVKFVGHPLLELIESSTSRDDFFKQWGLRRGARVIGLLPGSRAQEVERLLPVMLRSLEMMRGKIDGLETVVSQVETVDACLYNEINETVSFKPRMIKRAVYDLMKHSDLLLVASGTATLEAAIMGTPMVILYKMAPVSYMIARSVVKIPYIGLPNLIAGRRIVPELIQGKTQPDAIASVALEILRDRRRSEGIRQDLAEVKERLGGKGASRRAAEIALGMIERDLQCKE